MSVILSTPPPSYAFSGDLISAKFTCSNYLSLAGVLSVNTVPIAGAVVTLKYGRKTIVMAPSAAPDDSGTQYTTSGSIADQLLNFQDNYQLSQDFTISISGSSLVFTARQAVLGYDIAGYNSTPGRAEKIKPNYSVAFKLYVENIENTGWEVVHEATLLVKYTDIGMAVATIGDKLDSHILKGLREMYPDIPVGSVINCKKSCRRYYFQFAERYGEPGQTKKLYTSPTYTVLHGGLSYIGQFNTTLQNVIAPGAAAADRFLKQGNNKIYTRTNQPQFLYFFNTRDTFAGILRVKAFFKDGTEATHDLYDQNYDALRKYGFDVSYDKIVSPIFGEAKVVTRYEVQLLSSIGVARSEVRTYYLNYQYRQFVRYFLSWSSFGSMDTLLCYGKGNSEFELSQKDAARILQQGYDIKQGNSHSYDLSIKSGFKVATGWLSRRELIANRDFYLSPFKYRFTRSIMLPIRVDNKTVPEISDGNNLYAQTIEYSYQFDDHNYTEGDEEDSGQSIGDFFFSSGPITNPTQGFEESDPTVPAWVKSITQGNIDFWNSRGSGDGGGGGGSTSWENITGKPNFDLLFIKNQTVLQAGANFYVAKGKFGSAITLPLIEPPVKEPASFWVGDGATAGIPIGSDYTLPVASISVLGGVKIGTGLIIDPATGILSATGGGSESPLSFTYPLVRDGNIVSIATGIYAPINSETLDSVTSRGATTANNTTFNGRLSATYEFRMPMAKAVGAGSGAVWVGDGATAGTPGGGGSANLSGLTDVQLASLISGQALVWNGSKWINQAVVTDLSNYWTKSESDARFPFRSELGSFAFRNGINGNEVNTGAGNASVDIGVAEMLRWKNYGNNHVIFDASQGTSPSGTAIDPSIAQNAWTPSYPSLMGWNGSGTYGVKVYAANVADNSAYLQGLAPSIIAGVPNRIVQAGADGYINNVWFNSSRGDETSAAASYLFDTGDGYMRKKSLYNASLELERQDRHHVFTNYYSGGTGYNDGTLELISNTRPVLGFHWSAVVASTITIESSGRIAIMNNPGTGYESFIANNIEAANQVTARYVVGNDYVAGGRVIAGYDSGVAGSVNASGWFRALGDTGLLFATYAGGLYMSDSTWIRTFNSKSFYCDQQIQATTFRANDKSIMPLYKSGSPEAGMIWIA